MPRDTPASNEQAASSPSSTVPSDASGDVEAQEPSTSDEPDLAHESSAEPTRFELRDISVKFPEGKLTVVTGPTASGKTALLVRPLRPITIAH